MSITVLLIDDSVVVRQVLTDLINSEPGLEVMGSAADPFEAIYILKEKVPDVIVLDVEMPRMDGITFLRKLMTQHPVPVIMCSSVTKEGSHATLKALEYGAVDIIQKPRIGVHKFLQESRTQICDAIRAASLVSVNTTRTRPPVAQKTSHAPLYSKPPAKTLSRHQYRRTRKIITIGASTGGTQALETLLKEMPEDSPGTLIVQHMPEHFTKAFSDRLNSVCPMDIKEAEQGDEVRQGRVLIAPGGEHMTLRSTGMQKFYVDIQDGPLVSRHRPSVDQLFRSAAECNSGDFIGVILTGMGSDGASGMQAMKNNGAITIAQDEKTCIVFGMPQEAIKLGSVDHVLPLKQIAPELLKLSFSRI